MSRAIRYSTLIAIMIVAGCNRSSDNVDADMGFIEKYGHEYARQFMNIPEKSIMARYDFLLETKVKEKELRENVGEEYADRFIKSFCDSARIEIK